MQTPECWMMCVCWMYIEKEGIIYHTTEKALEAGKTVTGKINWEERFEKMQQHTGEHIVSGLVHERFGYNNVGFHLGSDYCTMDFDGTLTKEQLREIELAADQGSLEEHRHCSDLSVQRRAGKYGLSEQDRD